jgi:hypothetical protein
MLKIENVFWLVLVTNMSTQIYSRESLQAIPEKRKQSTIDQITESFINDLLNQASTGKSSYLYEIPLSCHQIRNPYIPGHAIPALSVHKHRNVDTSIPPTWQYHPTWPILDLNDVVQGLKKKFPDCKVNYEETWIEDSSKQYAGTITKTLKKGIVIDWS